MRIKCPIDMKQTALERKSNKLLLYTKKLILNYAKFRLFMPEIFIYVHSIICLQSHISGSLGSSNPIRNPIDGKMQNIQLSS